MKAMSKIKFNPHVNGDVFEWNPETEKDGDYIGRIDSDGDFVLCGSGMVPQGDDAKNVENLLRADLKIQYEEESGWAKNEWPEEMLHFMGVEVRQ